MNLQGWEIVGHSALHVEFKNQKIWFWTFTLPMNKMINWFGPDSPYWKLYTAKTDTSIFKFGKQITFFSLKSLV